LALRARLYAAPERGFIAKAQRHHQASRNDATAQRTVKKMNVEHRMKNLSTSTEAAFRRSFFSFIIRRWMFAFLCVVAPLRERCFYGIAKYL